MFSDSQRNLKEVRGLCDSLMRQGDNIEFVRDVLEGKDEIFVDLELDNESYFIASLGGGESFYSNRDYNYFDKGQLVDCPVYRIDGFDEKRDVTNVSFFTENPQDPILRSIHKLIIEKMVRDLDQLESLYYIDPKVPVDNYPPI